MSGILLPELEAIQAVAEIVDGLSPLERRRVAAWLCEYAYQDVNLTHANDDDSEVASDDDPTDAPEPEAEIETPAGIEAYDTFSAFFDAVAPKTGAQKAVTAGYWLEHKEGMESWNAFQANKLLKSIDVKVSSISIVLTNAVKSGKSMVTELARQGDGERSRKTFCINDAGVAFVEERIA